MFTTIPCATDGSEHAHRAVEVAADLGQRYGARVFVVTAYDPLPRELGSPYPEDRTARRTAAAEAPAHDAVQVLKSEGVACSVEVLEGPAARAILEVARVCNCTLIQEASCAVLIIR
jgi:nucleotide-binding universal stress UspA family protein